MATPARERSVPALDAFLRVEPVDDEQTMRGFEQHERNRDHFYSRREELLRDHPGKYVIVYDDDKILIGDDFLEMCGRLDDSVLGPAFAECLVDPIEFPSVWS